MRLCTETGPSVRLVVLPPPTGRMSALVVEEQMSSLSDRYRCLPSIASSAIASSAIVPSVVSSVVSSSIVSSIVSDRYSAQFVEWIPENNQIRATMCDVPPRGLQRCATFVCNSTAIQEMFKRVSDQCVGHQFTSNSGKIDDAHSGGVLQWEAPRHAKATPLCTGRRRALH